MKDSLDDGSSRITVCVRARPLNKREKRLGSSTCLSFVDGKTVRIYKNDQTNAAKDGNVKSFTFDHAYDSDVGQATLYEDLGLPVLEASLKGFNTCIFAYGQTGSGKSYSMMGPSDGRDVFVDPGIIPRLSKELFKMVEELKVANQIKRDAARAEGVAEHLFPPELKITALVSYMEIYQERINCLLNSNCGCLKVREHPILGVYVDGVTEVEVESEESILRLINGGNQNRHTAATNMNERSSRSHAIFAISLVQKMNGVTKDGDATCTELRAKINLVDLAGSERAKSTGAEGEALREGANINRSLTVLGLVISSLAQLSKKKSESNNNNKHVPYRNSILTFILKESLGGNSKTFMLSTLSPATTNYDETLSTLRYADRAKSIVTRAVVNETAGDKRIRELENEVRQLREKMRHYEELVARGEIKPSPDVVRTKNKEISMDFNDSKSMISSEISYINAKTPRQTRDAVVLEEELHRAEELIKRLTTGEGVVNQGSPNLLDLYAKMPTIKVSRNDPFLLNVDGIGDWVVEYFVVSVTYFGTEIMATGNDERCIVVNGPRTKGIAPRHCRFVRKKDGQVFLSPVDNNLTYINDIKEAVIEETLLESGDVICLGEEFLEFKFTDPSTRQKSLPRHTARSNNNNNNLDLSQLTSSSRGSALTARSNYNQTSLLHSCRFQNNSPCISDNISNPLTVVPALCLNNVLKNKKGNDRHTVSVHRDPNSHRMRSFSSRKYGATARAPKTSEGAIFTSGDKLNIVYNHTYLFIGVSNSGKSSFRENLRRPDRWCNLFSSDKLHVEPTFGVDSLWLETSAENLTVRINLLEVSGNGSFSFFEGLLPTRRVTYVLFFSLKEPPTLETLQTTLEFILSQSTSRDVAVVFIGSHLDCISDNSSKEIADMFSNLEIVVCNYFRLLQKAQDMLPSIIGCFAVDNKNRIVFSPGFTKIKRFPELLCWFVEQAINRCRNDVDFPNAQIPARALALKKKIQELRSQGRWCLSSAEYKTVAKSVDTRYAMSLDVLHRHTQLLGSWGVLHHHYRHLTMKKYVMIDVPWVFRAIAVLACCSPVHDANARNRTFNPVLPFLTTCVQLENVCNVLPFDIHAVHEADVLSLLNIGVLTKRTAVVLFERVIAERKFFHNSLVGFFEFLRGYDFIVMGSSLKFSSFVDNSTANKAMFNTDGFELADGEEEDINDEISIVSDIHSDNGFESSDLTEKSPKKSAKVSSHDNEEAFVLIPACFTYQPQSAFYLNLPSFLFGPFYRFTLNIVPHNFFPRVLCRAAQYAKKLYLGPVSARRVPADFIIGDCKKKGKEEKEVKKSGEEDDGAAAAAALQNCSSSPSSPQISKKTAAAEEEEEKTTVRVVRNGCFWDSMAWVICPNNSRALLRMVNHSIFVTFHTFEDDEDFYNNLCRIVRGIIHENPGVRCKESILCSHEFIEEEEKASEVHGDKVYWRGVDENINSLEKIREREQYALMTARSGTTRRINGKEKKSVTDSHDNSNNNNNGEDDDDSDSVLSYDEVIPFVRDRTECIDVEASVQRICAESFLTDDVLREVTAALHAMNDARKNGSHKQQCIAMDRLVDVLAHA